MKLKFPGMKGIKHLMQWEHSIEVIALLVGHFVFFCVLGLRAIGAFQPLELTIYDTLLWTKPSVTESDPRITLVWLDDMGQHEWGWPLPDMELAQLLDTILTHKPAVIGVDIYRDFPVPRIPGDGHDYLNHVLKNNPNIMFIKKLFDKKGIHVNPPEVLEGSNQVGFNDLLIDPDGVIRRSLLFFYDENTGDYIDSFAFKLALHYVGMNLNIFPQADPDNPLAMRLGESTLIPINKNFGGYVEEDTEGYQYMYTYPNAPEGFRNVSLNQVLYGDFEPLHFKDKIVIIGVDAEATPDFLYTPFGKWLEDPRVPGAEIHAYSVSQLIRMAIGESKPLSSLNEAQEILWIWVWSILSAFIAFWERSVWRFLFSFTGGIVILTLLTFVGHMYDVWVISVAPLFAWFFSAALMIAYLSYQEKNQRSELMQLFSKHVSKDVAEVIWKEREQYLSAGRLRSQRIIATVLFTDLQNFTTVSEKMEPQALMDWLNQYMETMVQVVEKQHHGQVNKFIGDAVMAVFGVPIQRQSPDEVYQDAINAVECALSMRREMLRLREVWKAQGLPLIRMRVGICTGPLVAGSLGGVERQEYTVLGDTVNTASRLESFDKTIDADNPCRILITETTLECLQDKFETDRVDAVYLKGKECEVTIHRVLSKVNQQ